MRPDLKLKLKQRADPRNARSVDSLLDMQVTDESLLAKYNLKANDAILAEGKQKEM